MVEYRKRYKFELKEITPLPTTEEPTEIIDERVKILVGTKEMTEKIIQNLYEG